ncbi:MAG: HlyD family efflux transporter periplasmic adaptor subunit [Myxococcota bacterium]
MPRRSRLRPLLALVGVVGLPPSACSNDERPLELVGPVERTLIELVATEAETIRDLPVSRGEAVEEGELVVLLDATLAEFGVAQAEASAAGARTGLVVAYHDLERVRKLRGGGAASEQDLDRALLVHDEAQARLREAEARLQVARKRRRDLELVAPGPGVLDQLPYEKGERVPAGAVVAVLLADEEPWVRVWVPETGVAQVAPGTPAEIRVDGVERTLTGRVMEVAREPEFTPHYALTERDRVHLVYQARVRILDAPPKLRPGLPARVTLHIEGTSSAAAP